LEKRAGACSKMAEARHLIKNKEMKEYRKEIF